MEPERLRENNILYNFYQNVSKNLFSRLKKSWFDRLQLYYKLSYECRSKFWAADIDHALLCFLRQSVRFPLAEQGRRKV